MAVPAGFENRKDFVNWSKREPKEAAAKVWSMVHAHESHLGWRHQMARRGALAYSGAGFGDLFEHLSFDGPWGGGWGAPKRSRRRRGRGDGFQTETQERHARAIVETVVEKLFGMDEPKPQLVATDAEWEVRRQGIWADRFTEGNYHLSQGSYLDFWDLCRQGGLMSFCSTGTVSVRTEPDFVSKRVRNQLRSTLNTFIDPADRANGVPLTLIDVTWENPEYMCADSRWTAKERDMIWAAATVPSHLVSGMYDGPTFGTPMVKWVTAWRLPFGDFKGRHAIFVGGSEEKGEDPLLWDDWEIPEWPMAFFRCNRALGDDFWGENMIDPALRPLADAEDIDDMAKRTMDRTSQTYISIDGSTTGPASVMNAKDVNVFRRDSKKGEQPPDIQKPGILNADYWEYRDRKIQIAHDLTHVSMMHQTGQVQGASGDRSGRSIRLEASLLPEVFARKLRAWRNWVAVDCAKNHIRAARLIGEEVPDWQVTWPGADFDAKVSVEVLNIDLEQFTIRPYAVSEQKNTPADRADTAQEMFDRGEINAAQLQVILDGLYDTKRETKASTAERRYVAKVADEMLYGDEELVANESIYMANHYIPPMPWIDPDAAMAQASPMYLDALIDGVPQNRRRLLRRFLEDIWALRMQKQRELAMQDASVNVAMDAQQAFPMGAPAGMAGPLATPPGLPPTASPQLGAPVGAPIPPPAAPGAPPALNAPGAPGMV